jgi:hypothetical protein
MRNPFLSFVLASRWASVILALMYHVRFLLFVDYEDVHAKTALSTLFYFLTGLGHESFAVFFVLDGILAGLLLPRHRPDALPGRATVFRQMMAPYRILVPGLILGAGLDTAGAAFFDEAGVYTDFPAFSTLTLDGVALLGNLFMLQPFAVPTFGSNGMLYLLSYVYWSFVLLVLWLRLALLGRLLLPAAVVALAPRTFLLWGTTWLAGVVVVHLGATRDARPSLPFGLAGFAGTLLLSRLLGADTHALPPPFGAWLIQCKYLLVGTSFAAVAWALYPARAQHERLRARALVTVDTPAAQAAAFTFFCHFPVMMLLVGMASTLLDQPLMRQPAPARYGGFAVAVAACLGTTVLVARAAAGVIDAVTGRRRGLPA